MTTFLSLSKSGKSLGKFRVTIKIRIRIQILAKIKTGSIPNSIGEGGFLHHATQNLEKKSVRTTITLKLIKKPDAKQYKFSSYQQTNYKKEVFTTALDSSVPGLDQRSGSGSKLSGSATHVCLSTPWYLLTRW